MRRWLVSATALLAGLATTFGLLWYADPGRTTAPAYVLVRDIPAGATIGLESVRLVPLRLGEGTRPPLGPGAESRIRLGVAAHDLQAGQLLQSSDLADGSGRDRRLVAVPVKAAPPVAAGDHVDLLLVTGAGDRTAVVPFALGLEVRAVVSGALVVVATSRSASGLVYAGTTGSLIAVVADRSAGAGQEPAVASLDDAEAAVRP